MRTVITAGKLRDGNRLVEHPVVVLEDGQIESIATRGAADLPTGAKVFDFPDSTLAPAFFDVHFHGAAGHDVMEATP